MSECGCGPREKIEMVCTEDVGGGEKIGWSGGGRGR